MQDYEGLPNVMMNLVLSFSPSEGSNKIAAYAANYLNTPLIDITSYKRQKDFDYLKTYDYLIFCFPVYSQNIPMPVKRIMKHLKAKYYLFLVTYGKMGIGNVIHEISKIPQGITIGGAYIPTKHTYIAGDYFNEFNKLDSLLDRVNNNEVKTVNIPYLRKHILASFFPNYRSRINVKIKRTNKCINCNLCNKVCPTNAITNGLINSRCIRCLRCFQNCSYYGLEVRYSRFLKLYLKKDKLNKLVIY